MYEVLKRISVVATACIIAATMANTVIAQEVENKVSQEEIGRLTTLLERIENSSETLDGDGKRLITLSNDPGDDPGSSINKFFDRFRNNEVQDFSPYFTPWDGEDQNFFVVEENGVEVVKGWSQLSESQMRRLFSDSFGDLYFTNRESGAEIAVPVVGASFSRGFYTLTQHRYRTVDFDCSPDFTGGKVLVGYGFRIDISARFFRGDVGASIDGIAGALKASRRSAKGRIRPRSIGLGAAPALRAQVEGSDGQLDFATITSAHNALSAASSAMDLMPDAQPQIVGFLDNVKRGDCLDAFIRNNGALLQSGDG